MLKNKFIKFTVIVFLISFLLFFGYFLGYYDRSISLKECSIAYKNCAIEYNDLYYRCENPIIQPFEIKNFSMNKK